MSKPKLDEVAEKNLKEVERSLETLQQLDEKKAEEIYKLEQKYIQLKRAVFKQRNDHIRLIPQFWKHVFLHHEALFSLLDDVDIQILDFLELVDVVDRDDGVSGYSILFYFASNPFFSNKALERDFNFDRHGDLTTSARPVKWKDLTFPGKHKDSFFVLWFNEKNAENVAELGSLFHDEIFPDPAPFYTQQILLSSGNGDREQSTHKSRG